MNQITVDAEHVFDGFKDIFDDLDAAELQNDLGKEAVKVCRKYKPKIKVEASSDIKKVVNKSRPYASTFVPVTLSDSLGIYGAVLWNRNFRLSHLVNAPHKIFLGGHSNNAYYFWNHQEQPMVDEFWNRSLKVIDKHLKGR